MREPMPESLEIFDVRLVITCPCCRGSATIAGGQGLIVHTRDCRLGAALQEAELVGKPINVLMPAGCIVRIRCAIEGSLA